MILSRQALPLLVSLWLATTSTSDAFSIPPRPPTRSLGSNTLHYRYNSPTALFLSDEEKAEINENFEKLNEEEKKAAVGNLVADDEWEGLGLELGELVRVGVIEGLKKNTREFLGKEDYKVGDISKEIDDRVKGEVAKIRGKEEYELGDFVLAMDEMSKSMTEELTGKGKREERASCSEWFVRSNLVHIGTDPLLIYPTLQITNLVISP